ncbi:MAG TPA: 3D domain-containing protein [Gaiellaceae bacterium]|nr:3D domain-containing protein [Gaiellaceae bacterium]
MPAARFLPAIVLAVATAAGAITATRGPGLEAAVTRACPPAHTVRRKERPITHPRWLTRTTITEYWPTPERWFVGKLVRAPGLAGRHRVDWLYGAHGLPMEGEGVGLDGRRYRFLGPYGTPWVNEYGTRTRPCASGPWTNGRPFWLSFGWRNSWGGVTFPLANGGWWDRRPARFVPPPQALAFGRGSSRPLVYWRSAAVDPKLIPFGSRIFVRSLCHSPGHGWVVARDTGGAIIARHIDVYRPPPSTPGEGQALFGQRIFVVPPGRTARITPRCS